MTTNRFFSNVFILVLIVLMINSCKKNEDSSSSNPTNGKSTAVFNPNVTYGTMTDQDGNVYKTVTVGSKKSTNGTQTWMAENLRTTKYRDGSPIPEAEDKTSWSKGSTSKYCNFKNTLNNDSIATFGRLYNAYAATDSRQICPVGWHVPSETDFRTLISNLGGGEVASQKLMETGTTHWSSPNTGASNESGFTAISGPFRFPDGGFDFAIHNGADFWTNTLDVKGYTYSMGISIGSAMVSSNVTNLTGRSIRCVKD